MQMELLKRGGWFQQVVRCGSKASLPDRISLELQAMLLATSEVCGSRKPTVISALGTLHPAGTSSAAHVLGCEDPKE